MPERKGPIKRLLERREKRIPEKYRKIPPEVEARLKEMQKEGKPKRKEVEIEL